MKREYYYIFATPTHWRIENLIQLKRRGWDYNTLGFYIRHKDRTWTEIGAGELRLMSLKKKFVHTDGVSLNEDRRRKGHGIHLYFALIRAAKVIGAKRIYSAKRLNKFSGNMWCNKLREFFDVRGPKERKTCSCRCSQCKRRWGRYYIDLTKIALKDIPR